MNYIDLHCDTLMQLYQQPDKSLKDAPFQINLAHLKKGGCLLQCFAVFVPLKKYVNPFETSLEMINRYETELNAVSDWIHPVYCYDDLVKNIREGKISSLLTIEEGGILKGNLSFLRTLYRLGVRMICLNWNDANGIGYPNFDLNEEKRDFTKPNVKDGLTAFGFELVRQMNRLGMIVDVSHLSDAGFYDCIRTSVHPIVASHSNARSICHHVRNLSDDMIVALHKKGGVMGLNFCAAFLDDDPEKGKDTVSCVIRHMKHIKNLVGVDVMAIGTDFDGIPTDIALKNASFMPCLIEGMRQSGFTQDEIEKICYKNFLRVFQEIIG